MGVDELEQITFAAAVALGCAFVASGFGKMRDVDGFVLTVIDFQVIPRPFAVAVGRTLPNVEALCGIALVIGFRPDVTASVGLFLLLAFFVGVSVNLRRGRTLACHCFGTRDSDPISWVTVIRISALLVCAGAVVEWRGHATIAAIPSTPVPDLLLASALLMVLYLLRTAPPQWSIWRTIATPGATLRGGCVSVRDLPLDRSRAVVHSDLLRSRAESPGGQA